MPEAPQTLNTFEALIEIIAALRGPDGRPWDNEQTHESLVPYAIEEVFELAEALESKDDQHMCEELGDVLFQVILHAGLASERKAFNIFDVIEGINTKVVRRHPHVFSGLKVSGKDEILKNWDEIKKLEKANRPVAAKKIDVPAGLPALQRACKIGEKTQKLNFDWVHVQDVLKQLKAEIQELEDEMAKSPENISNIEHEMGDVLFSAAQLARHLKVEPESCLREANRRFLIRFEKMFETHPMTTEELKKLSSTEKEKLWQKAKMLTAK